MSKFIRNFTLYVTNKKQVITQFGRWCIPNRPNSNRNATLIMDRSNEDHCGVCGDNLLYSQNNLIKIQENNTSWDKLSAEEKFYFPYTM